MLWPRVGSQAPGGTGRGAGFLRAEAGNMSLPASAPFVGIAMPGYLAPKPPYTPTDGDAP